MNDSPEDQFARHFLRIVAGELDCQAQLRIGAPIPYLIAIRLPHGETYMVSNDRAAGDGSLLRTLLEKLERGERTVLEPAE